MANNKHLQHVKSRTTNEDAQGNKSPKLPTIDQLLLGEIAINYANGYERMSIKNDANEIVEFVSKEYVDASAGQAADVKEVQIGGTAPSGENTIDLFVDTSVDPLSVEVYNKAQIDAKVTALETTDSNLGSKLDEMVVIGTTGTTSNTDLFVDTSVNTGIEVYTKAQVDTLVANLQQQIDELKPKP